MKPLKLTENNNSTQATFCKIKETLKSQQIFDKSSLASSIT